MVGRLSSGALHWTGLLNRVQTVRPCLNATSWTRVTSSLPTLCVCRQRQEMFGMFREFALPPQPVRHVSARLMMSRLCIHVLLLLELQKTPCRLSLRTDDIILQCVELRLYLLLLQEEFGLVCRRHFYLMPGKIFQPPTAVPDPRLALPESGGHDRAC